MMIKIKKLIPIFLIMILLNNCGYTPRYAVNKNINFTIDLIEFTGDREFGVATAPRCCMCPLTNAQRRSQRR